MACPLYAPHPGLKPPNFWLRGWYSYQLSHPIRAPPRILYPDKLPFTCKSVTKIPPSPSQPTWGHGVPQDHRHTATRPGPREAPQPNPGLGRPVANTTTAPSPRAASNEQRRASRLVLGPTPRLRARGKQSKDCGCWPRCVQQRTGPHRGPGRELRMRPWPWQRAAHARQQRQREHRPAEGRVPLGRRKGPSWPPRRNRFSTKRDQGKSRRNLVTGRRMPDSAVPSGPLRPGPRGRWGRPAAGFPQRGIAGKEKKYAPPASAYETKVFIL